MFDVNGEYANENTQDGKQENAACLKNIISHTNNAQKGDVSTYGQTPHPNDPDRKIVKINFFGENPSKWTNVEEARTALEPLFVGKTLIDNLLANNLQNTSLISGIHRWISLKH